MIRTSYKVIGYNGRPLFGIVLYKGEDKMEATRIYHKESEVYEKLKFYKITTELLMEWTKQGDEEND